MQIRFFSSRLEILKKVISPSIKWGKSESLLLEKHLKEADKQQENHENDQEFKLPSSTFWHSSAHLLGWAMERKYGRKCFLTDGPATSLGFFYDALLIKDPEPFLSNRSSIIDQSEHNWEVLVKPARIKEDINVLLASPHIFPTPQDLKDLTKSMSSLAATNQPFEFLNVTKSQAQQIFIMSPFKLALLDQIPLTAQITLYKCGDFIDLCRGPHIPSSSLIKGIMLPKTSASQWSPFSPTSLSRIYGITFESNNQMKSYKTMVLEAEKRNHRKIGKAQKLFTFHPHSPGSPFFLPHGVRIVQRLKEYLREEYKRFGFQEVITPLIFNKRLWQVSGHWQNYKDDMFVIDDHQHSNDKNNQGEREVNGLKPMNCPGHCLLYADSGKSYRDLPLRYAEFSPLHRNEASGALTGLTRVRKFHQDDGHIFCTRSQIKQEIESSLLFIDRAYKALGFTSYQMSLSTRPEKNYIGTLEDWNHAENALKEALDSTGKKWDVKDGDGAFYGPKIDITIQDAIKRSHQTATIQLDFQLPSRFKLSFAADDGSTGQPVMIHRAVLGSIERMMGILIENYSGKWPFWLSPRQAIIVTTRPELQDAACKLNSELKRLRPDYYIDVDETDHTLPKQIREAQIISYNFILVLGDREVENETISLRSRDGTNMGEYTIDNLMKHFDDLNFNKK